MERWNNVVAVVTGASSGIGKKIAQYLVKHGMMVAGLARRVELVEEFAEELNCLPGKLYAVKCDVGKIKEVQKAFQWVKDNLGSVQVLINNAGILKKAFIIESSAELMKEVIDVNLTAATVCCQEAIKQMKESNLPGHIVLINSLCGHKVLKISPPNFNAYPLSKFGITALTEVLRQEICHFKLNIKITSLSPGLVDTEIFSEKNYNIPHDVIEMLPHLTPEDVAECVIFILGTPPHVQVHELTLKPLHEEQ